MKRKSTVIAIVFFLLLILASCITSCKPKKELVEITRIDTIFSHRSDTVHTSVEKVDSIVYRDSVFTIIKGDTVLIEKYHYRYNTKSVNENAYKSSNDTVWQTRTVTEYKTQYVEVEKKLHWWQTALMWLGVISIVALLALIIGKVRKLILLWRR